ncbi:MAG: peptidase M20, partial [Gemmatimonadaceae bacterium]|nr:peptidase M20 [Gemmatimonadaceae bacterium]
MKLRLPLLVALVAGATPLAAQTVQLTPVQQQARAIFRELIEINTSWKEGSTTPAAHAIAKHFLDAGWAAKDVVVTGP